VRIREIWHNQTVHDTIVDYSSKRELQQEVNQLKDSLTYYRDQCKELQQVEKTDSVQTIIKKKTVYKSVGFWNWGWLGILLLVVVFFAGFFVRGKIPFKIPFL